jgi:hypothetical protein
VIVKRVLKCVLTECDLIDFIGALALPVRFVRRPNGWKHERDLPGKDRDSVQQLNKRNPPSLRHRLPLRWQTRRNPCPICRSPSKKNAEPENRSQKSPRPGIYVKREKMISL